MMRVTSMHQTRGINHVNPMSLKRWATVYDAGPALKQHRVNPLDPSLLVITASPTEPSGAVDPIGDIIIDHILSFKGSTQLS